MALWGPCQLRPGFARDGGSLLFVGSLAAAVVLVLLAALGWLPTLGAARAPGQAGAPGGRGQARRSGGRSRRPPGRPGGGVGCAGRWSRATTSERGRGGYPGDSSVGARNVKRFGSLLRYRVAVEEGLPIEVWTSPTWSTPRWATSGAGSPVVTCGCSACRGRRRTTSPSIWPAPPRRTELRLESGVDIRENGVPYTSCRARRQRGDQLDRYFNAVPDYPSPLSEYRQYVINHEVGHRLGYLHTCARRRRACPGDAAADAVGLQGCVATSWPYIDGEEYSAHQPREALEYRRRGPRYGSMVGHRATMVS